MTYGSSSERKCGAWLTACKLVLEVLDAGRGVGDIVVHRKHLKNQRRMERTSPPLQLN